MSAAVKALEAQRLENEPPWIAYFREDELAAEFAHCNRDLARSVKSEKRARQAAEFAERAAGASRRSDFFALMVLAQGQLGAGRIEEACRTALDGLDIGAQLKSARAKRYVREFHDQVKPFSEVGAVREFTDAAREQRLWVGAMSPAQ